MSERSPRLSMPYIQPAQAQKHVTHNEALALLDVLVQTSVASADLSAPPDDPATGSCYIVASGGEGDWQGQDGTLAQYRHEGWRFTQPQAGYTAWVQDLAQTFAFDGTTWAAATSGAGGTLPTSMNGLGINASFDSTNRLTVAADGVLFNNDGAGHRVSVNKASDADTASLLFQSNWTGHAEMGLAGDTRFSVKVSADGATWVDALAIDPNAQSVTLSPAGTARFEVTDTTAQLDVPLYGSAVQSGTYDATTDRLLTTGAFGWGAGNLAEFTGALRGGGQVSGVYRLASTHIDAPATPASNGYAVNLVTDANNSATLWVDQSPTPDLYFATDQAAQSSDWQKVYHSHSVIGPVATTAGIPQGGVIERGSNANGDYVRFADGTQICWSKSPAIDTNLIMMGSTGFYAGAPQSWTFPMPFANAPDVQGTAQSVSGPPGLFVTVMASEQTSTGCSAMLTGLQGASGHIGFLATGRWD